MKQKEVLDIVKDWFNTYKKSPTLRDIAAKRRKGKQVRSVVQLLTYMESKGVIRRHGRKGIEILPLGAALLAEEENPWC